MKYPKNANFFMFFLMIFFIFIGNVLPIFISKKMPFLLTKEYIWIYQSSVAIICFIVPIFIYKVLKNIPFKDIFPLKKISLKNIILIIFISFTIQPMLQLIGSFTNLFYKDEISSSIYIFASLSLPKALFTIALVPAITEELVFRGVILSGFKQSSLVLGILISSLYFGLMHFTLTQLFYAIVAGIIFSLLVKITKSIYSAILMHFIFNGTQITIAHFTIKYIPNIQEEITNINYSVKDLIFPIIQFLLSLPFLALSIYLFIKNNKKEIEELKLEEVKKLEKKNIFTLFFYINIIVYIGYMVYLNINL